MTFKRIEGDWNSTQLADIRGIPFKVGDLVARAFSSGMAVNLEVVEVTEIKSTPKGDRLYLNNSKGAIQCPGRLLIVTSLFTGAAIQTGTLPPPPSVVQTNNLGDDDATAELLRQI